MQLLFIYENLNCVVQSDNLILSTLTATRISLLVIAILSDISDLQSTGDINLAFKSSRY